MTLYRIKDWEKHFENNRSKLYDRCSYVCMPNKQDGMGLQRILATPNGAALFGIWCLLLQKASRQRKGCRSGWFTDDGMPDGQPWSFTDLGFQWRQDPALIQAAVDLFTDPRIGWAEAYSASNRKKPVSVEASQLTGLRSATGSALPLDGGSTVLGSDVTDVERKKERKKERVHDKDEDETGGVEPEENQIIESDEILLHLVRSKVFWQVKELDKRAQHEASILAWLRSPDRKMVLELADREHRTRRKAVPWWELEEILTEQTVPVAEAINTQVGWPLTVMMKSYPIIAEAVALVEQHGWQWARDLWRYTPAQMPDHATAMNILRTDVTASEELVRKAKAIA